MDDIKEKKIVSLACNIINPERIKFLQENYSKPKIDHFSIDSKYLEENKDKMACTIDCYDSSCQCLSF